MPTDQSTVDNFVILILAYDASFQCTHTTTYGYSPAAKDMAAEWGEKCTAAIGADLDRSRIFEDFRATSEAENRRQVEDLTNRVKQLESAIHWALGDTDKKASMDFGTRGEKDWFDEGEYAFNWRPVLREKAGL